MASKRRLEGGETEEEKLLRWDPNLDSDSEEELTKEEAPVTNWDEWLETEDTDPPTASTAGQVSQTSTSDAVDQCDDYDGTLESYWQSSCEDEDNYARNQIKEDGQQQQSQKQPWWNAYKDSDILAFDTEQVMKSIPSIPGRYRNHAAAVEIVDYHLNSVYSTAIRHARGTLNPCVLTMGARNLESWLLPSEEDVKEKVRDLLENKLVITVGGEGDFAALGLDMNNYDLFDLQSHWWRTKINAKGVEVKAKLSLQSLAKYYLSPNPQEGAHSSQWEATVSMDAMATMRLFRIYQGIKMGEDADNLDVRKNKTRPYNEITFSPNPIHF